MNARFRPITCSATAAIFLFSPTAAMPAEVSSIEYRGTSFSLPRAYEDFRAYKDDPNNLRLTDLQTIERLIRSATFGPTFRSSTELVDALFQVAFPGYGSFYANQLPRLPDGLELVYVEIPKRGLNRYFVLRQSPDGSLSVVADFVVIDVPEIVGVRASSAGLVYVGNNGQSVVPELAL